MLTLVLIVTLAALQGIFLCSLQHRLTLRRLLSDQMQCVILTVITDTSCWCRALKWQTRDKYSDKKIFNITNCNLGKPGWRITPCFHKLLFMNLGFLITLNTNDYFLLSWTLLHFKKWHGRRSYWYCRLTCQSDCELKHWSVMLSLLWLSVV